MKPVWTEAFQDRPLEKLADYLLLALLFFMLPFVVVLSAHDGFITPKWCALGVGVFVIGAMHFWRAARGRDLIIPLHPINGLIAGWWVWKLIGLSWAPSFRLGLEDFAQATIIVSLTLLAQSILYQERRRIVTLGVLMTFSGGLIAVWVIVLDFLRAFSSGEVRVLSRLQDWRDQLALAGFGNTGHISDYLTLCFLATLCALFFVQGKSRIAFYCVLLWLQAAALIVCWSFHSNVSLVVASALLANFLIKRWKYAPRFRSRLPRLGIAAAGWLAVVLFYAVDHPANPHQTALWKGSATAETNLPGIFGHAFSSARWQEGGVTRQAIWLTSIQMIKNNPLLGVGTGNFTYVYPTTQTDAVLNNSSISRYAYMWTNAAHNMFLQQESELGIVGLLVLLGLIGSGGYFFLKRMEYESTSNHLILAWGFCALVALTLQGQMNFILELPVSSMMFFFVLSLPMILPKRGVVVDLIMPVTRPFGPFEAGIMMKNMRMPTALVFMGRVNGVWAIVYGTVLAAIAVWGCLLAIGPTRASMRYKPLYEEMRMLNSMGLLVSPDASIQQARSVLELNPGHRDARANLVELLLLSADPEKAKQAVEETELLGGTLQDAKYLRLRAQALAATGKEEEALVYWNQLEERFPATKQPARPKE